VASEALALAATGASPVDSAKISLAMATTGMVVGGARVQPLHSLPNRDRRIAEMLATGEKTGDVAQRFHLSAARISQLRSLLRKSWEQLHGELGARVPQCAGASSC